MMGLLVSFWLWALDNAPKGDLAGITPRMIARAAQWDGEPEKLAETLVQTARIRAQKTGRPDDITAAVLRLEKSG